MGEWNEGNAENKSGNAMNVMGMQGHGNAENLGVNSKNVGNQAGDARNQDRNLSMTVEII